MEQTEQQSGSANKHNTNHKKTQQTDEAKAHGYDASKYERPSVMVDVVMMSLWQKDLK